MAFSRVYAKNCPIFSDLDMLIEQFMCQVGMKTAMSHAGWSEADIQAPPPTKSQPDVAKPPPVRNPACFLHIFTMRLAEISLPLKSDSAIRSTRFFVGQRSSGCHFWSSQPEMMKMTFGSQKAIISPAAGSIMGRQDHTIKKTMNGAFMPQIAWHRC
jgi:hypothetical protein